MSEQNILEQAVDLKTPDQNFNSTIHLQTESGDPDRKDDGTIKLKTNWKTEAVDRQGRKFNPKIHTKGHEIDADGYLTVRRRDAKSSYATKSRTEAFVAKYKEEGYAYYVMNDVGGRMEQFLSEDWEVVSGKGGNATIKVGQARDADTTAVLMKKPIEWYEEDQRKKREMNEEGYKVISAPKEEMGQYEANPTSPLR